MSPTSVSGQTQHLRVLVAEDNDVNRFLIVAMLERLGHSVVAVVNGREAVDAVQNERFDAVMMDVQMPVANGIDATQAIRALPGRAGDVPIVAVTANVLPEQQAVYRRVGFTDWLPKPLTLEHVEAALARLTVGIAPTSAVEDSVVEVDEPLFDQTLIDQHRRMFGEARAMEMVATFTASLAQRREELHACVGEGDLNGARSVGHTIKGMGGSIGARRLWAAGERLQHATDDMVRQAVVALEREADAALAALEGAWHG